MAISAQAAICMRRAMRRPFLAATSTALGVTFALSLLFYTFEHQNGPPYDTYFGTLRGIIVLTISGFDVQSPVSTGALVCSYLIMGVGVVYVGFFTAWVAAAIVDSRLRRGITMSQISIKNHILVCGWTKGATELLGQLLSPDHHQISPVVVIDAAIEEAPLDHHFLHVVRGDPTDHEVLKRANAAHARVAIVLADRDLGDPNLSDARTLLIALAVESLQPDIYSCIEVLNAENVKHFERIHVDEIISPSLLSNRLLAQAAHNPGISRLIYEILTVDEGEEMYLEPVPKAFVGRTFAELSNALVSTLGIVLVGVSSNGAVVVTSRTKWRFKDGDRVYLLAESRPVGLKDFAP